MRIHNHPDAQLCLTSCTSLFQVQAECCLLQNYWLTENCFSHLFLALALFPHIRYTALPWLLFIPSSVLCFTSLLEKQWKNLLHSEPGCPHQCWEQKLSSLNSCAVLTIKMMMWRTEGENNLLKLFCSDSRSFMGDVSQSLQCYFQGTSHSMGIQSVLWEAQYSWELRNNEEQLWSEGTSSQSTINSNF